MSGVLVIGMGGTIAMASKDAGEGVVPSLTARQLVDAVPGIRADLEVHSLRQRPGGSLTLADLAELRETIERGLAAGAVGAVVTQGTDTIEETAYVLGLWHDGPQPIVVTGAMRNPTLAGADGPANLLAATVVAAAPECRDLGCLVVLADEIHAAAAVRKTHTASVSAFTSPNGGPLGHVAEGRVRLVNRPARRFTLPALPRRAGPDARVAVCVATLGDDGGLLPVLAERCDGLVVAGFGVGHVPESWVPGLEAAARRIPVVLASRTGAGFTSVATYGYPGSERDLVGRGLIPAGGLDPYKARLLLQLLLNGGADRAAIADAFARAS